MTKGGKKSEKPAMTTITVKRAREKGHRSSRPEAAALGRGSEISLCSENRLRVGSISEAQRNVPKSVKMWILVCAGVHLIKISFSENRLWEGSTSGAQIKVPKKNKI